MKTITEMQAQIKEMSSKLDEFAIELSDYNQSENEGAAIDFKQIKAIGIRNPIIGHILEKADESIKKKYITMLIAIAYMAKEKQENAWLLIQRIAAGANFTEELIDLNVDAINITDAQIDEFTLNIANEKLSNAFVLDAMLIYLSCENSNDKMLEFLVAIFELVKCGKKEVQELTELARIIARQDSTDYLDFCTRELKIDVTEIIAYVKLFHQGVLCFNNKNFILFYNEKKKMPIELLSKLPDSICSKKVVIENVIFSNINDKTKWFDLTKCVEVSIVNCEFDTCGKSLNIVQSEKILLSNTKFSSMSKRALYFNDCQKINIKNCIFARCSFNSKDRGGYGYKEKAYGGAIYAAYVENLEIENSLFDFCVAKHEEGGEADGAAAYLSNISTMKWNKNKFKSCRCTYWRNGYTWQDTGSLFYLEKCNNIEVRDCTQIDCGKIPYEFSNGFKS